MMYSFQRIRHVFTYTILLALLAGFLAVDTTTYAQEQTPETSVVPAKGRPATVFAFYARGFDDTENVAYWFNAPDGTVYGDPVQYTTHTFRGRADWTWRSPDDAMPGIWTAVASSTRKDGQDDVVKVISFEIVASETAPPDNAPSDTTIQQPVGNDVGVGVVPAEGLPGVRFSFYATDFFDHERVAFWYNAPDGTVYGDPYFGVNAYRGRADWQWTTPGDAQPGVWTAVASGVKSGATRVIQFTILSPVVTTDAMPANSSAVAVSPEQGQPGTRFHFSASGFLSYENVHFWATAPDGTQYKRDKYNVKANEVGTAYWNWGTPEDAATGYWTMMVMGDDSQVQHVIYFEVW